MKRIMLCKSAILILWITVTGGVHAEERERKPVIWTNGYYAPLKARFPQSQFEYLDPEKRRRDLMEEGYLEPHERDEVLKKAGITRKLKGMDEMNKDILILDAGSATIPELRGYYPKLTETELRRLKAAIKKVK